MARQKELRLPFPIRGLYAGCGYESQPALTSPSLLNVRAYSSDAERARGGSRPGLARTYNRLIKADRGAWATSTAYAVGDLVTQSATEYFCITEHTSGTFATDLAAAKWQTTHPVKWIGWLDSGQGDVRIYVDDFAYAGTGLATDYLKDRENSQWTSAANDLVIKGGDVWMEVAAGAASEGGDTGANTSIAAANDDWQDSTLEADLSWSVGATVIYTFWQKNTGGASNVTLTVTMTSEEIAAPGLGFRSTLSITLSSSDTTISGRYSRSYEMMAAETGGPLRLEIGEKSTKVYWKDRQVIATEGNDSAITFTQTGFSMNLTNSFNESYWDLAPSVQSRVKYWSLVAKTRPTTLSRKLVAVAGKKVFYESVEGTTMAAINSATDEYDFLTGNPASVSGAYCDGNLFLLDGSQPKLIRMSAATPVMRNWAATKGKLEVTAKLICNWRNRLVLAGTDDTPHAWFMSRVADPWDWEYGQDDAMSAVAGSSFENGQVGDRITALCPINNNLFIIGCTRSIWAVRGDPAAGGIVVRISDGTGILSQNAWCLDAQGRFYFLGGEGVYRMIPGGQPENMTGVKIPGISAYTPVAGAGAAAEQYLTLAYDEDRHGILMVSAPQPGSAATGYYYELRADGWFQDSYPALAGPISGAFYAAVTAGYRKLLLGGFDGYMRSFSPSQTFDHTTTATAAIASHVWLGPSRIAGTQHDEALLKSLVGVLSPTTTGTLAWELYPGDTVYDSLTATAQETGTFAAGRNRPQAARIRDGAIALKLSNSNASYQWGLEAVEAIVEYGGYHK